MWERGHQSIAGSAPFLLRWTFFFEEKPDLNRLSGGRPRLELRGSSGGCWVVLVRVRVRLSVKRFAFTGQKKGFRFGLFQSKPCVLVSICLRGLHVNTCCADWLIDIDPEINNNCRSARFNIDPQHSSRSSQVTPSRPP